MSSSFPIRPRSDPTPDTERPSGDQCGPPLQGVIGAAKVLVWSADSLGNFEWVCGCWSAMTGQPAQAALGTGWLESIHPNHRTRLLADWHSIGDVSSNSFESLVRVRTNDGGYGWRLLRANRVAEPADQGDRWLGVFLDIDAIAEARAASESSAEAVLNTVMEGIVTISDRGVIESFNPAAEKIFGYGIEEVVGQNVSILMPAPYAAEHDTYLQRYLLTGEKQIIGTGREVTGRRKDGSTFPLDLAVSEVQLMDRRLFTGVVRDLTELRSAQAASVRAERLAGIGQMVAAIGHESRNALQRIQASAEMLKLQLGDRADCRKDIDAIERADGDLRTLFSDLRTWVTPPDLVSSRHDVRDSCNLAWEHALSVRGSRQARLEFRVDSVDTHLDADGRLLEQVFRNLFENALDAASDPVRVVVEMTDSTLGSSPAITVLIRDNGPGVAEAVSQRLFEAFYTTKRRGVGLGLAIAKRIVEAHHGVIDLRPAMARGGTEINLTLPRSQPDTRVGERSLAEPPALLSQSDSTTKVPAQ